MTLAQRLSRIPLLVWIVAPLALAALVAWPLGGWDTVTLVSRTLPQFKSNQVLHTRRFDIRVDDAWLTTNDHPAGYGPPEPGEIYLVVRVEITNVTDDVATASDLGGYLIPLVDGLDADRSSGVSYVLATDHTSLPELNPGLPRDMELVWTVQSTSIAAGDDLRIDLYDGVPAKSTLFYGLRWDFVPAGYAIRNVNAR
ncbi:MAG: hypothetical protein ABIQ01_01740 [Pseudolysinimonas sp.]